MGTAVTMVTTTGMAIVAVTMAITTAMAMAVTMVITMATATATAVAVVTTAAMEMEMETVTAMEMATAMAMAMAIAAAMGMGMGTAMEMVMVTATATGMAKAAKRVGQNKRSRRLTMQLRLTTHRCYHCQIKRRKELSARPGENASIRLSHALLSALKGSPRRTRSRRDAFLTAVASVKSLANVSLLNNLSQIFVSSLKYTTSLESNHVTFAGRRPKCTGYGALCYDPRFIGGDGVMFYFHGAKGSDFAIFSDDNLHVNAHLIGTRPQGRTRDFTWVQALSVMFDSHTLVLGAKRVPHWDTNVDALIVKWDGESVFVPKDGEAEWRANCGEREVIVERTDDNNTVRVTVSGLVEMDIRVTPIGEEENRVHNYRLPSDDAFAHLETQFRFFDLSDDVEGVLGKTYRPGYVSPVKRGVAMPMMGGEDKYKTPSLYSPACKVCRFKRPNSEQVAVV